LVTRERGKVTEGEKRSYDRGELAVESTVRDWARQTGACLLVGGARWSGFHGEKRLETITAPSPEISK